MVSKEGYVAVGQWRVRVGDRVAEYWRGSAFRKGVIDQVDRSAVYVRWDVGLVGYRPREFAAWLDDGTIQINAR